MPSNITFGVSTWLFTSPFQTSSIDELFPKIKAMGFDTVEIAVEDPALIDGQTVKEALDKYQLKAIVCGAFGPTRDLTSEDPAVHANCFNYIKECMDLCALWDTKFFAGPMYSAVGKARMLSPEKRKMEWYLAVANLRKVCQMAADRGLEIAIEPLNRFESDLVNTAADALRMVNDIDHSAAKILLDGFHMNIEEPSIEQAIKTAGDKLIHVQVAENYRGTPGTGQVNWDAYKRGLDAINYQGTISIESFTPDNKELAQAVCIWHPLAESQDKFASEGLAFLKQQFS
ncbi:sugar phosphate isomerase/epimerase family protein [Mucilaginibacter myungsuensis]|uniref:Sugar phosphate isomerase/epimerase n=1 Tax=Mucilaginibacter myungsuensis TaxID=649104 RepID=A0A929KYP2_9SPHI|nr:sugar phosphate isomerase/epimerase [Mucilaginibacter myungsuensis]MBE9662893.1 sugar phosphate isomerase/epimerase [Mucilaginibacter myungsuensis]MDN3598513.1 sugar phosphate isomerase/epimerase [Mucilaginibacter myungsuensis]